MNKTKPKKFNFIFAWLGFGFSCQDLLEEGIGTTELISKTVLYMIFSGKRKNMRKNLFFEASRLVGGSSVVVM